MNLKEILQQQANIIQSEVRLGANTANRIGTMFLAIIDAIIAKEDLAEEFLSKSSEDQTKFLIDFLGGLKISDKAHIDSNGNAKLQRLIVEGSMVLQELIYNRVTAVESDQWHTAAHTVESVKEIEANTLQITFTKRWENDFIAFREGDILMGSANELDEKGVYYTSFVRVVSVNVNTNSVVALLYPDNEVPGAKNYAPTKPMLLVHRGSVTDVDRQRVWYTSSREGREVLLSGVDKPILEYYNYAYFNGLPIALPQFEGLPINYKDSAVYARTFLYQDAYRIDYQGKPVPTPVDLGIWDKDAIYTNGVESLQQSDVWHHGAKWRCIVPSTKSEPRWNSTDWVLIEGSRDVRMVLDSTNGTVFRAGFVDTAFIARVYFGNTDITDDIAATDWEWLRESSNPYSDMAWISEHNSATNRVDITDADVVGLKTKFICRAFVRYGDQIIKTEDFKTI